LNKPLPLLRVENLVKHFPVRQGLFGRANGAVRAVDGIDFELRAGETLALVGESAREMAILALLITGSYHSWSYQRVHLGGPCPLTRGHGHEKRY